MLAISYLLWFIYKYVKDIIKYIITGKSYQTINLTGNLEYSNFRNYTTASD